MLTSIINGVISFGTGYTVSQIISNNVNYKKNGDTIKKAASFVTGVVLSSAIADFACEYAEEKINNVMDVIKDTGDTVDVEFKEVESDAE